MELTQLKYFHMISKLEHFTKASEELHVSQPSLSKSIANLESELGVPLFDRDKRSIHLNRYGQAFLVHVDKILAQLGDATTELADMRAGESGNLYIVSSFLFDAPSRIAPFLRTFYFNFLAVSLHVFYQDPSGMLELLRNRRVDFAFTTGSFAEPDIEERSLFSYRLGLIVGENHPLACRSSVHLAELAEYPFLSNNSSPDLHDTIYGICAQAGFHPKIAMECDNADLIGEAVAKGLGIGFASESRFIYNQEETGDDTNSWKTDLVFIPVLDDFCQRSTSIAWLKNSYQTTAAQLFLRDLMVYKEAPENKA